MKAPRKSVSATDAVKAAAIDEAASLAATNDAQKKATLDSFVNFNARLGIGADNIESQGSYGFNPISRVRTLVEWMHRGSWLAGVAVDGVADDMTRAGVEIEGTIDPKHMAKIHKAASRMNIMGQLRDTVAWSRLYGGAIAVLLVDGQKPETPFRKETVGKGQFKGLMVLDRWMVEPSMSNLVTEFGPDLGMPKFYSIRADAPALPSMRIHHTRCIRLDGVRLPYWSRVQENLWGISVLERIYDRLLAFDSATTGAAQLVNKAYIRTYKIEGLREIVAAGGPAMDGLAKYVDQMRHFQGLEGISIMDASDTFEGTVHNAFGGLSDILEDFEQQLSGALQIPLVRLFGQSPAGFSTGESDLRNYYDMISAQQERELGTGMDKLYQVIALSEGIAIPEDFAIHFNPLWQMSDEQKATIAGQDSTTIGNLEVAGTIDRATALKELKQSSRVTGRFTNITTEMIEDAEGELAPSPEDTEAE